MASLFVLIVFDYRQHITPNRPIRAYFNEVRKILFDFLFKGQNLNENRFLYDANLRHWNGCELLVYCC